MNIKTSSTFSHSTGEEAQPTNAAPVTTTTTPFTNSNSTSNSSKTPYISTLSQKGDPQKNPASSHPRPTPPLTRRRHRLNRSEKERSRTMGNEMGRDLMRWEDPVTGRVYRRPKRGYRDAYFKWETWGVGRKDREELEIERVMREGWDGRWD